MKIKIPNTFKYIKYIIITICIVKYQTTNGVNLPKPRNWRRLDPLLLHRPRKPVRGANKNRKESESSSSYRD